METDSPTKDGVPSADRGYPDLHDHLRSLEEAGLLITVDRPINKDTEMHPLVRWQFRGGIPEKGRKGFLFTNVIDSKGRKYDIPVAVGALASSRDIYRIGIGCQLDEIAETWTRAISHPVTPRVVEVAPCQEMVVEGHELDRVGGGPFGSTSADLHPGVGRLTLHDPLRVHHQGP